MLLTESLLGTSSVAANYIEDVFSTYLYTGNGTLQGIGNGVELGPDTGNSTYFNGGQINTNSSTSAFSLGTDAWTVECWIRSTYTSRIDPYELNGGTDASSGFFGLTINASASGDIQWNEAVGSSASAVISATGTAIVNGSWHHVAITRSGNSVRMFLDGTQIGSTYTTSYTYGSANKAFRFGNRYPGGISSGSNFYISNFRIVKGTALYTSSFTPPSASLTQISGTSYLAHQSISSNTDTTGLGNGYVNAATPNGLGPFNYGTGKGGMVWLKSRSAMADHGLFDTARGVGKGLRSNLTNAQFDLPTTTLTSFNSTGFSIGDNTTYNTSSATYTSWTFRKQAKFFDVVTFTAPSSGVITVNHNLGSVPGCVITKSTGTSQFWIVNHRSLASTKYLVLDTNAGEASAGALTYTATATTVTFSAGYLTANANYVMYLFAHDAGGFGASGSDNVISCGSYTGTGAAGNFVSLGYEPQWLLIKRSDASQDWFLFDNMRGLVTGTGGDLYLNPNLSSAEGASGTYVAANATGFTLEGATTGFNASGGTYIYIAIRRGPMKTPTSGTSVYTTSTYTGTGTSQTVSSGLQTAGGSFIIIQDRNNGSASRVYDTSRGPLLEMYTQTTNAEVDRTSVDAGLKTFNMNGFSLGSNNYNGTNQSGYSYVAWQFRRAPGFFDVVCYTGTGSATTVSHNLGVVPELMIVKPRNLAGENWIVYNSSLNTPAQNRLVLNGTFGQLTTPNATWWNSTSPTSSVFSLGTPVGVNGSSYTYVAYLFATCPGVSKVGSYTGTGTTLQIDCGFTGGARFVLIKRTDSTGDWYVWDSARGIVAGNDPYLLLNSTALEVTNTDYVDTYSAGFEISSTAPAAINANGGSFIFLAIA